jgi:hypothetical protein
LSSETDPLGSLLVGLVLLLQGQGDLVVLFDRLERVAPPDIQPDVEAVHEALKEQAEATQELGGGLQRSLASSLISGLQSAGSYQQVEQYIRGNCDVAAIKRRAQEKTDP